MSVKKFKLHSEFEFPWLQEQIEHWGAELLQEDNENDSADGIFLSQTSEIWDYTEDNETELFSFKEVEDPKHFAKVKGRFLFNPELLKSDVGHFILKRKLMDLYTTNIDDIFPAIREQKFFKLDSHVRLGFYSDQIAIECFERGYDLYKVRNLLNNLVYYLEYLNQSKISSRPMELTVAFTDETCIFQIISSEYKYYLDHILEPIQEDGKENIQGFLRNILESAAHLEIFRIEMHGKLGIACYLPKDFMSLSYSGFSFASIEKAPFIRESSKSLSNILRGYLTNMDKKEEFLKSKGLPGKSFSIVEINSKGSMLKDFPGNMIDLAKHLKDKLPEEFSEITDYHEIPDESFLLGGESYENQDFLSMLSKNDVFDLKEILNSDDLLNNFEQLQKNSKITVKDNSIEEIEEVIKFQADKYEKMEANKVKGVTEESDENIMVKGSREELENGFIKVKGGNTKETYGEILQVLSKGDLKNEEDVKKILASRVAKKLDIPQEDIENFIDENIGDFEYKSSLDRVNETIKNISAFDEGIVAVKDMEISNLKQKVHSLETIAEGHEKIKVLQEEVENDHGEIITNEIEGFDSAQECLSALTPNSTLTDFEIQNIKRVIEAAHLYKEKVTDLQKRVRKAELANASMQNHFSSELRKSTYAQEKRHSLLLKTKDLLGKQIEAKKEELFIEKRKNEKLAERLDKLNAQDFTEQKRVVELENKVRILEGKIKPEGENSEPSMDLNSFVEIKKKLEVSLREKDEKIAELMNRSSSTPVSGGPGGNVVLEAEIHELKKILEEKDKKLANALESSGGENSAQKNRELEHKLKLAESIKKTQEKEIAHLKKINAKVAGSVGGKGQDGKRSKLLEKQLEKMKEESAKHDSVLKKHKQEISKFKSENTALKNELDNLRAKLKRAS